MPERRRRGKPKGGQKCALSLLEKGQNLLTGRKNASIREEGIMKLTVGGRDRTTDLGAVLSTRASQRRQSGLDAAVQEETDVLNLLEADGPEAHLRQQLAALRSRNCVVATLCPAHDRRAALGRCLGGLRRALWRLLRGQFEWMAYHQNAVNVQLTYALEFENEERRKRIAELEERVKRLEAAAGGPAADAQ